MLSAFLTWWYGAGWAKLSHNISARIDGTFRFFSIKLLVRTLFDPFRQIDAGGVRGPLQVQMRALFDRTFSRFVGLFVRLSVVLFGLLAALFFALVGAFQIALWPLLPFLPVVALLALIVRAVL